MSWDACIRTHPADGIHQVHALQHQVQQQKVFALTLLTVLYNKQQSYTVLFVI